MGCEKLNLFVIDDFGQQFPVLLDQMRVSFDSQHEGNYPLSFITHKPIVDIVQLRKDWNGEFSYLIIFADKPWFDRIKHRFGIFAVFVLQFSDFAFVLVQKGIEKNDSCKVLVDSFGNDMSQILILVCKEAQDLLGAHIQRWT